MAIQQLPSGQWLCQIDRKDIPRVRRRFETEAAAVQFELDYLTTHNPRKLKSLPDLIQRWLDANQDALQATDSAVIGSIMLLAKLVRIPQAKERG